MLLSAVLRGAHDTAAQADALPEAFALAALTVSKVAASPSAQAPHASWLGDMDSTGSGRAAQPARSQRARRIPVVRSLRSQTSRAQRSGPIRTRAANACQTSSVATRNAACASVSCSSARVENHLFVRGAGLRLDLRMRPASQQRECDANSIHASGT